MLNPNHDAKLTYNSAGVSTAIKYAPSSQAPAIAQLRRMYPDDSLNRAILTVTNLTTGLVEFYSVPAGTPKGEDTPHYLTKYVAAALSTTAYDYGKRNGIRVDADEAIRHLSRLIYDRPDYFYHLQITV